MVSKISNFISSQFSKPNGFFGNLIAHFMKISNKPLHDTLIENIDIKKTDIILDIGFASGNVIEKLLNQNPKKIYGIDISEDMVNLAKKNLKNEIKNNKVELELGDVEKLPFNNDFFTKIYTINTVYFWNNSENALNEINRTLQIDGIFYNLMVSKEGLTGSFTETNFKKYTIEEFENITKNAGFEILNIIEVEKDISYCIISKKKKSEN